MAEKLTERFEMRLSQGGMAKIDQWRRYQPDIPPRAEAIRRLVERGLAFATVREASIVLLDLLEEQQRAGTLRPETAPVINAAKKALAGADAWSRGETDQGTLILSLSEDEADEALGAKDAS